MDKKQYAKDLLKKDVSNAELQNKVYKKFHERISRATVAKLKKEIEDEFIETEYENKGIKKSFVKEKQFLDRKYNELLQEVNDKEKRINLIEVAQKSDKEYKINKKVNSKNKTESTMIIGASDWHAEETVDPETIDHLNAYNLDIAQKRATNFFQNSLKLKESFEKETPINNMVLWLGGDFVSGYIHEELLENNSISPTEAIIFVKKLIKSGINFYLDNSNAKITIVTSYGNHGRTTQKSRVSTSYKNNFEWLLYNIIAQEYEDNERIDFKISKSYFNYLQIYDKTVRFHHGDWIKYNGGVGGIYIPTNKAIAQWNKGIKADIDVFGHYHQFIDGGNFVCNGSLIGYGPYAQSVKAGFEEPKQMTFLINEKFGKTIVAPIFVNE